MSARKPNNLPWIILGGICCLGVLGVFGFGIYMGAKSVSDEVAVSQSVELPKTDLTSDISDELIIISVTNTGQISLDDKAVDLDTLVNRLVNATGQNYSERIYIRGAHDADYQVVMKVMARVNAAGFSNLGLVTEPVSAK